MMNFFILISLILLAKSISSQKCTSLESVTVETKYGKIKGVCTYVNAHDKIGEDRSANVFKYLSIPYAEAPVDEKRFKEPVPKSSWSNVLDASNLPKSCFQAVPTNISSKIEFTYSMSVNKNAELSEDCLYLNVYTSVSPKAKSKESRPVMVIIHGGSDRDTGSSVLSIHEPSIFVAMTSVVVVTFNYRLGILGNLYYNNGTEFFQGNQGFLDQHLALKWINENIKQFGGDPNRITLMGYGSGALYASYHMIYKPSWQLFRNVILQSYSPINLARNHLSTKAANNRLAAFLKHLDCSSLKCLYEKDAASLVNESRMFLQTFMSQKSRLSASFLKSPFQSVVDGKVFTESVIKSFREGRFKKCFMIVGFNSNDGASLLPLNYGLNVTQQIDYNLMVEFLKKYYNFYPNWPMRNNDYFFDLVLSEYTKNVTNQPDYFRPLRKMLTDETNACSMLKLLEYLTKYSDPQQKIYFYIYEHRITTSKWPSSYGVVNGDELASLFAHSFNDDKSSSNLKSPNPFLPFSSNDYTKIDRLVAKEVINKWYNFLYNDDPNKSTSRPFKLRDSQGKVWNEFKMNQQNDNRNMLYFSFKSTGTFSFKLFNNQTSVCNLWNKLIPSNLENQNKLTTTTSATTEETTSDTTTTTTTSTSTTTSAEALSTQSPANTTQTDTTFEPNQFESEIF